MVYNGMKDGVIYRQAIMRKPPNNGVGYIIDLADIIIPGGVIRVDRSRLAFEHELTLGHFGLPHIKGAGATVNNYDDGSKKTMTASIKGRQIALIAYTGWDKLDSNIHKDRNAEADESTVLYAYRKRTAKNPAMEVMITALLHKMDDTDWTEEELSPLKDIKIMEVTPAFSPLGAEISLSTGKVYKIYFEEIDGKRMC
jgi:hypothetical protein